MKPGTLLTQPQVVHPLPFSPRATPPSPTAGASSPSGRRASLQRHMRGNALELAPRPIPWPYPSGVRVTQPVTGELRFQALRDLRERPAATSSDLLRVTDGVGSLRLCVSGFFPVVGRSSTLSHSGRTRWPEYSVQDSPSRIDPSSSALELLAVLQVELESLPLPGEPLEEHRGSPV